MLLNRHSERSEESFPDEILRRCAPWDDENHHFATIPITKNHEPHPTKDAARAFDNRNKLTIQADQLLTVNRSRLSVLKFFDILNRELRPIDLERQFVEFSRKSKRRLIILIIDACQRVGANIKTLIPL